MPSFKDTAGNEWQVAIDAPTIKLVRRELDNFDLVADDAAVRLSRDHVLLVDVLWLICREQAGAKSMTDMQFGRLLVGEPIEHATKALIQALHDFFPPGKRSLLRCLADEQAAVLKEGTQIAEAKIKDPTLRQRILAKVGTDIDDAIQKILTGPSGVTSWPESADSGPTA